MAAEALAVPELSPSWWDGRLGSSLGTLGGIGSLAARTARSLVKRRFPWKELVVQVERIGVDSLSVVLLTAIFSSMVMTIQFAVQMARFGAKEYVANVVSLSLARELGPVLTALMVGGRVGAGIAAELGSMAVTEQIDAVRALGADPVQKLVLPRVIATVLLLPLMTSLAVTVGVGSAMVIASVDVGVPARGFYQAAVDAVELRDFLGGILKTVFFGANIGLVACHLGMNTRNGTVGVGNATTKTVVVTSVVTLISDFILTKLFMLLGIA